MHTYKQEDVTPELLKDVVYTRGHPDGTVTLYHEDDDLPAPFPLMEEVAPE